MNWKTILVPHDFSASADHAAAVARSEAKQRGSKIILLHAVELPHHFDGTAMIADENGRMVAVEEYATTRASAHLTEMADAMTAEGVPTTARVVVGTPIEAIERAIAEYSVDVIVMGTHGRTGIRKLIAGSVAERVVRTSAVPVLTIRHPDEG